MESRVPTVLQVLPALEAGGVVRGAADVAKALADAGRPALVVSAGGPMMHEIERAGARHVTLPLASKNPLVMRPYAGRSQFAHLIRGFTALRTSRTS